MNGQHLRGASPEAALARACDGDRRWFAAHPERHRRLRRRIVGEFQPFEEQAGPGPLVVVAQVRPGLRLRAPVPLAAVERSGGVW